MKRRGNAAFEWQADSFSLAFWRPQNSQTFTDPTQFSQTFKALKSLSHFPQTNKIKVPCEIKISWDLRGGRWSWTLSFAQKRSWVGRWSWAAKVGLLLLRVVQVVRQQQCNGHCLCDSVQEQQVKQQLRSAQVAGQWRGDTAITLPLFWRRSTVSPVFFGRYPRSSLHSFVSFPLCPRPW